MKDTLKIIGLLIVMAVALIYTLNNVGGKFEEENSKLETMVGKKLILQKDTLLVIDYSFINSTIKFENGKEISFLLAKDLECVGK